MKSPLLQRCVAGVIFSSGCFYSSLMPMDRERMLSLGKQIAEIMWLLSSIGMYIHAERKILVSYNKEKDILFLSPGGTYHRIYRDKSIICSDYHCNFVFY